MHHNTVTFSSLQSILNNKGPFAKKAEQYIIFFMLNFGINTMYTFFKVCIYLIENTEICLIL